MPARHDAISDRNLLFLNEFLINPHEKLITGEVHSPRSHRVHHVRLEAHIETAQTVPAVDLLGDDEQLGHQTAGILMVLFASQDTSVGS